MENYRSSRGHLVRPAAYALLRQTSGICVAADALCLRGARCLRSGLKKLNEYKTWYKMSKINENLVKVVKFEKVI